MSIRVGIVGIAGYGGGELLRYITQHPQFKLVYAAGESTAGQTLGERFPSVPGELQALIIEPFDPTAVNNVDLLFTSLPTGASKEPLAIVGRDIKIVDIGGDHRYVDGWTYGLADVWPEKIHKGLRVANPGCFPAAALTALAPLLAGGMVESRRIIINAATGLSGAGRGASDGRFSFAETNEDFSAYGLLRHTHMPEIEESIARLSGDPADGLVFTPHLVPMTRGILVTIYARGRSTTAECLSRARSYFADRPFVRVTDAPPHTKWASGSNYAFVSYAADPARDLVIAMCAIDNLGKGAAGQAIQNANMMCGLPATSGLDTASIWP